MTRVSFTTSMLILNCFLRWSPSKRTLEEWTLGLGRDANIYMERRIAFEDDGDLLVIEVDGKATPTATEKELEKRRGKRKKEKSCCQRHRGRGKRKKQKRKRRKKGDKSKNGRSITLVVMYTLKKGEDGLYHGPYNKVVWGSYAPRKVMLAWARKQATLRGFPPGTTKKVHIAIDGEKCLEKGLSTLFPDASFVLDIRHLEEKIWTVGRSFYKEGSQELEDWVESKRSLLYEGKVEQLIEELKELQKTLSKRAKRDQDKYEKLQKLINYMEPRISMMDYKNYIDNDYPIASGIVEGAARYVIGERMDCSGMRWIPERAEAVLRLRCIELNGNWDDFFQWIFERNKKKLMNEEKIIIRSSKPLNLLENINCEEVAMIS